MSVLHSGEILLEELRLPWYLGRVGLKSAFILENPYQCVQQKWAVRIHRPPQ